MAATILVVDHIAELREIYHAALRMAGFTVHEAEDGAAAVAAIVRDHPDAIVLHVGLPDIDGVALARQVLRGQHGAAVPMVAITGWPGRAEELKQAGVFRDVLIKPVLPEQLIAAVQRCLDHS